jgi:hypothetical protein
LEKSLKNLHHSSSPLALKAKSLAAVALAVAATFSASVAGAKGKGEKPKSPTPAAKLETHLDLIQKAQNLTLQRDRLQASQVLSRGLQQETKGSAAYKELARALEDLTAVFYSEKAQGIFAAGESDADLRPRDALAQYQEALRVEEGNVTVIKAIARTHLTLKECDRADVATKSAEAINEHSPEVKLLRLQVFACQKNLESLAEHFAKFASEMEQVESFTRGLNMRLLLRDKDLKKARALLASWEAASPDYPELHYWKWELSRESGAPDRMSAVKYTQLCQGLSPRKKKSYSLDTDLCRAKEEAESFLKESSNSLAPNESRESK